MRSFMIGDLDNKIFVFRMSRPTVHNKENIGVSPAWKQHRSSHNSTERNIPRTNGNRSTK